MNKHLNTAIKNGAVVTSVVAIPGVPGGWTITLSNGESFNVHNGTTGATGATGPAGPTGLAGLNGASAYDIAVNNGFVGGVPSWLASLVGAQGQNGATGATGPAGDTGPAGTDATNGADGQSAFELALSNGYSGAVDEWLDSLVGPPGIKGDTGATGATGPAGAAGANGESAHQLALDNGFAGTQSEWLTSLIGATGPMGPQGSSTALPSYNYFGDPNPSNHAVFGGFTSSNLTDPHTWTLYGSAAFTSTGSYACYGSVDDSPTASVGFVYNSGSSFTTYEEGATGQGYRWMCIGF